MTLQEMGALLREERERQGISLEKAAADIKISKKYLIALEEGQTEELPHPVYAKGFVKNYARLLGLDPEEMGAVLSGHYAVEDDHLREIPRYEGRESGPAIKERKIPFARPSSSSSGPGLASSLVYAVPLLLVFAGLAWFFFFSSYAKDFSFEGVIGFFKAKVESSVPGAPEAPKPAAPAKSEAPAPKAEAKPEPRHDPAPAPADQGAPVQRDLLATTPGAGAPAPQQAQPAHEPAITAAKLASEAQFAAAGRQVVEVNANQPASVEVSTEDGLTRAFTLVKGQRLSLRFNEKITVRFLQAPSVGIRLNGKDYPVEGGKAEGKSVTFH